MKKIRLVVAIALSMMFAHVSAQTCGSSPIKETVEDYVKQYVLNDASTYKYNKEFKKLNARQKKDVTQGIGPTDYVLSKAKKVGGKCVVEVEMRQKGSDSRPYTVEFVYLGQTLQIEKMDGAELRKPVKVLQPTESQSSGKEGDIRRNDKLNIIKI